MHKNAAAQQVRRSIRLGNRNGSEDTSMAPLDSAAKAAPAKTDKKRDKAIALAPNFGTEVHGYYLEDLKLGMTAVYTKTVTEADIATFAGVSGDTNPIHLSDDFAKTTMFEGRIAHGMLSASFISTLI